MATTSGALRADSRLTREAILEAAITLFATHGYGGTSLRAIAELARVNIAAANYHFGSKENLFKAAFERCVAPINARRLARLQALGQQAKPPTSEAIVRAFIDIELAQNPQLAMMMARVFAESQSLVGPLLQQVFGALAQRYIAALELAQPDLPRPELEWRFHFLIGAMLQMIRFDRPLEFPGAQATKLPPAEQVEQLVRFVVAGLNQNSAGEKT
ncbi:MAG: TetR family transcriptional regulator [Pseudomonadota bacterium]